MTEQENRIGYWTQRFESDGILLTETQRIQLTRAVLEHLVGIPQNELEAFLDPDVQDNPDPEKLLLYSLAEQKIANFYNGPLEDNPEDFAQRMRRFLPVFRENLKGLYSDEEMDKFISYMKSRSDASLVSRILVGHRHWIIRRVRNAYLPGMTNLIVGGKDITHTLFDGPDDAVSQIEKLLGEP